MPRLHASGRHIGGCKGAGHRAAAPRARWFPCLLIAVLWVGPAAVVVATPEAAGTEASGAGADRSLRSAMVEALSRPAPPTAPAGTSVLEFRRDPSVTHREREAVIRHLASQPGDTARVEEAIRSGRLLAEYDTLLRGYGYSPTHLGDVLASHLVIAWEIVNEADSNANPAGQRAVRRQLAGPLASVAAIAGMPDAEKQAQAERTAYMTMIWATAYQELRQGGQRERLRALQHAVRRKLAASGIDAVSLTLVEGGLVAR